MDNARSLENNAIGYESIENAIKDGKIKSGPMIVLSQFCLFPVIASAICASLYLVIFTEYFTLEIMKDYMQDLQANRAIITVFSSFYMLFMFLALMLFVIIPAIIKSRFYPTQFFFHEDKLNIRYMDEKLTFQETEVNYYDIRYIKVQTKKLNRQPRILFNYFLNGYLNKSQDAGMIEIHTRKKEIIKCCYTDLMLSDDKLNELKEECKARRIKI
ncbi:hypothetical protein [Marinicellulosiphila megalodicopiae]|uniref:hypothetical protein n=1 Tax=Marinicellulosiphila megalodicopiae TaxID=2724896 RepID=UPI003BB0203C